MEREIENPEFIFDMFKFISTPNRMTMRLLVFGGNITRNQLRSDLMELFSQLYEIPIERRMFHLVLNSYVARYLQSVAHGYHKTNNFTSSVLDDVINQIGTRPDDRYFIVHKMPVYIEKTSVLSENNVQSTLETTSDKVLYSSLHLPHKMALDNHNVTKESLSVDIPAKADVTECDVSLFPEKKDSIENNSMSLKSNEQSTLETISDGLLHSNVHKLHQRDLDNHNVTEEFLSVEVPVKADATGCNVSIFSEKEDICEELSVSNFQSFVFPLQQDYTKSSKGYLCQNNYDKMKLENANLLNNNFQNIKEAVDSDEFSVSDDECYDPAQNFIISRYLDSLNSSSSESKFNYNEICFDSDSDDSVIFSENIIENIQKESLHKYRTVIRKEIESDASNDFDFNSEDSVEFFEICDSNRSKISQTNNVDICDTENYFSIKMSNSLLFESCDNVLSYSLPENIDSNFRKNNEECSNSSLSLSQDKMRFYSTDFGGFFNPCFEDVVEDISCQVKLISVNNKWEDSMQDISCEPRQPKRVSFPPLPDLVSVQMFEPDEDDYRYSLYVLDQLRFKNRIQQFEEIIKPYLSPHHREKVYQRYNSSNDQPLALC